jgi:hypothetical protein
MSKILDKATAHFRSKLSEELQSIVVPEWDNIKIYFKSVITLREQGKMIELAGAGKQIEALVESLIIKARNEDGTRMFNVADKPTLMNEVDPSILIRVVSEINNAGQEPALDAVEKN